jgi:hypothetical protein
VGLQLSRRGNKLNGAIEYANSGKSRYGKSFDRLIIIILMDELLRVRDAVLGPFLLHALEPAPGAKLRRGTEAVGEQDSIEMVDLMLKSAREKSVALQDVRLAIQAEE